MGAAPGDAQKRLPKIVTVGRKREIGTAQISVKRLSRRGIGKKQTANHIKEVEKWSVSVEFIIGTRSIELK